MSALLVYGIAAHLPENEVSGLDESPLMWVDVNGWRIACSTIQCTNSFLEGITSKRPIADHPAMRYQNVAINVHRSVSFIPMSFPTLIPSVEELHQLINASEYGINHLLTNFGGLSEHSFRVLPKEVTADVPTLLTDDSSKAVSYLKNKWINYQREAFLSDAMSDIQQSIADTFGNDALDYQLNEGDEVARIHILCKKKGIY
ncbi:MAG: GvpL/GvpF family gas vesicle protein [Bacteroidota bacterium]